MPDADALPREGVNTQGTALELQQRPAPWVLNSPCLSQGRAGRLTLAVGGPECLGINYTVVISMPKIAATCAKVQGSVGRAS